MQRGEGWPGNAAENRTNILRSTTHPFQGEGPEKNCLTGFQAHTPPNDRACADGPRRCAGCVEPVASTSQREQTRGALRCVPSEALRAAKTGVVSIGSSVPVTRPRGVTLVNRYSLTHVPDSALLHDLRSLLARERATTAELLAQLAEVDARKLYAPAGYPSMFAYCVEELRLSEDVAYKRIQVARTALRFPVIFGAVAEGRLNLSGVALLAPHLGEANADELLAAAAGRTRAGIEEWLAQRFPRSELLPLVMQLPADAQLAPG